MRREKKDRREMEGDEEEREEQTKDGRPWEVKVGGEGLCRRRRGSGGQEAQRRWRRRRVYPS